MEVDQWLQTHIAPLAQAIAPTFVEGKTFTEANDQVYQEAMFTLQFLLLHRLNKEAVKVADGDIWKLVDFLTALDVFTSPRIA